MTLSLPADLSATDDDGVIVHNDYPMVLRAHVLDMSCWCQPTMLRNDAEIDRYFDDLISFGDTHIQMVETA